MHAQTLIHVPQTAEQFVKRTLTVHGVRHLNQLAGLTVPSYPSSKLTPTLGIIVYCTASRTPERYLGSRSRASQSENSYSDWRVVYYMRTSSTALRVDATGHWRSKEFIVRGPFQLRQSP